MNKFSTVALVIILIQLNSQSVLSNPESKCNYFKNYKYCAEFPDNIEVDSLVPTDIITYKSHGKDLAQIAMDEISYYSGENLQQRFMEIYGSKGYRKIKTNETYEMDGITDGSYIHAIRKDAANGTEEYVHVVRYKKPLCERSAQIIVKCCLGAFQNEGQIRDFLTDFRTHCLN